MKKVKKVKKVKEVKEVKEEGNVKKAKKMGGGGRRWEAAACSLYRPWCPPCQAACDRLLCWPRRAA